MIRTTNLILDLNSDNISGLQKKVKLYKYEISRNFNFKDPKHLKTHNEYKDKLNRPYYFHSFGPAIYVLYDKEDEVLPITFEYLKETVHGKQINFSEVKWSTLIKTLMSYFLYSSNKLHRICQNKIYGISKIKNTSATSIYIDIRANTARSQ